MKDFLLDTNVTSEMMRARPDSGVVDWFDAQESSSLFLSVITVGEMRRGFLLLDPGRRRDRLEQWLIATLLPRFNERILSVTLSTAELWAAIGATTQRNGTPRSTSDSLIAATALEHGLTVVTRNITDFVGLGVDLLNPWHPS